MTYSLFLPKPLFVSKAPPQDELMWQGPVLSKLPPRTGKFHLHGGPPFANGDLHLGHGVNLVLKDVTSRFQQLLGRSVQFDVGWDGHGLPLEQKALKEHPDVHNNPGQLRTVCGKLAEKFMLEQMEQMKRLGVAADYSHAYKTWDPAYEACQLRFWATLQHAGLVYRAVKPVYWSTVFKTALAEAELEYKDVPGEGCVFTLPGELADGSKVEFLVFTTQPWTLLANEALGYNPAFTYYVNQGQVSLTPSPYPVALQGAKVWLPWDARAKPVLPADYVDSTGTGLVHLAPGHGKDDYAVCMRENLPVTNVLNVNGDVEHTLVQGSRQEANDWVKSHLQSRLVAVSKLTHSYPHCWRSHQPVVTRGVYQWFVKVEELKPNVLNAANTVNFVPKNERFRNTLAQRADWCVSRQRVWGVPLPVFYNSNGEVYQSEALTLKLARLVESAGSAVWWEKANLEELLGVPAGFKRGQETLDVWMDSGTSSVAVLKGKQADLYLEGSDQHRGWFQSSAWVSMAVYKQLPYKNVYTHGFVVGPDKVKLSKSNGARPLKYYLDQFGADVVRLWVVSTDTTGDVTFSQAQLQQAAERYRQLRNSLKVVLGNLQGETPKPAKLSVWGNSYVGQLRALYAAWNRHMQAFAYHSAVHEVSSFLAVQFSKVFLDSLKDTLYCDAVQTPRRQEAVYLLDLTARVLLRTLYPFTPFMVQMALTHRYTSLPEVNFPEVEQDVWNEVVQLKETVNPMLETLRQQKLLGKGTEATVQVTSLVLDAETLADVLGVSSVTVGTTLQVSMHKGVKCPRCWKFHTFTVELCPRCSTVHKPTANLP